MTKQPRKASCIGADTSQGIKSRKSENNLMIFSERTELSQEGAVRDEKGNVVIERAESAELKKETTESNIVENKSEDNITLTATTVRESCQALGKTFTGLMSSIKKLNK